jgi:hypothetical protein
MPPSADQTADRDLGYEHEAVAIARVSSRTLYRWAEQGIIPPPKKVGNKNLWDLAALRKMFGVRGGVADA